MISYTTYKIVHYLGLFVLVVAVAAALGRLAARPPSAERDPWRRSLGAIHGLALFFVLLGGFGMLARLEVTSGLGLPGWIWAKLAIWTALGGVVAVARRRRGWTTPLLVLVPVLAMLAGAIALTKPF